MKRRGEFADGQRLGEETGCKTGGSEEKRPAVGVSAEAQRTRDGWKLNRRRRRPSAGAVLFLSQHVNEPKLRL